MDAMSDSTASSTTANDLDLIYLKGIMESPVVWYKHTYYIYVFEHIVGGFFGVFFSRQYCDCVYQEQEESLKELHLSPVRENNVELLQEILRDLDPFKHHSNTAAELASILKQPHFQVRNTCMYSIKNKSN